MEAIAGVNIVSLLIFAFGIGLGIFAYWLAKIAGPLFPLLLFTADWSNNRQQPFPLKVALATVGFLMLIALFSDVGWLGLWRLNLLITIVFLIFPKGLTSQILRGTKIVTPQQLQRQLSLREVKLLRQSGKQPLEPKLSIGGVVLPNYLENLSFGFFGAPGSGKSQSILQILDTLRDRKRIY
ncbi:MAG: type IV secretion system DNA-binding domain-containing protein [Nostochopsis sp.]